MTREELIHFKKMVRVYKTKSLLFCLWLTNSFSKAKSYSFNFHENYVTWPRSANGLLQLSNGWGNLFPHPATLHLIYKALIQPHVDYCNVVWGNCGVKLADKLQKLPKSCSASSKISLLMANLKVATLRLAFVKNDTTPPFLLYTSLIKLQSLPSFHGYREN